jgi:hypothetical protein
MPRAVATMAASFWAGATAFKKAFVTSFTQPTTGPGASARIDSFGSYEARRLRYELYWAFFENSAYDAVHQWSQQFKTDYSLYRYTRGAYNPAYRLGEFWAAHTMGGTLDPEAGDGKGIPSALPILTDNPRLRPAVARLWRDSNWQVAKDVFCRLGAVLGDVGLKACDDEERGRVVLEVVDPSTIKWVDLDSRGNVRAYVIEEPRLNPDYDVRDPQTFNLQRYDTYTEWAFREGEEVKYATFRNGRSYAWSAHGETWVAPYGFVPLVLHQHVRMAPDVPWGWSELHGARVKIAELDDLASKLHDQIRKVVHPKWFFAGVQNPATLNRQLRANGRVATTDEPEPGREDEEAFYGPSGATVREMVAPLDIQFTSMEIQNQLQNLERDYPELQLDSTRVSGDASGKAQVEARRKTEAKVHARRVGADDSLVRAMQMAIAIAGMRGYDPAYDGFGLDSYAAGDLGMRIDVRPVFALDPADVIAQEQAFWTAADVAVRSGMALVTYLRRNGWKAEQIDEYLADRSAEEARKIDAAGRLAAATAPPPPPTAPAPTQGA